MSFGHILPMRVKYLMYDACYHLRTGILPRPQPKRSLAVLYLYAERDRYPRSFGKVRKLVEYFRGLDLTCVSIDNFYEDKQTTRTAEGWFDIGGDNRYWEFSGWQKGMQFLRTEGIDPQWVLFVNDAFLNEASHGYHLPFYTTRVNRLLFNRLDRLEDVAIGVYDRRQGEELLGYDVSGWIRSNFFLLPLRVASEIKLAFLGPEQIDGLLPATCAGEVFLPEARLNGVLRGFLQQWVTEDWHRGKEPCGDNWGFLKSKVISILNERMLTAQLGRMGVPLVDLREIRPAQVCCGRAQRIDLPYAGPREPLDKTVRRGRTLRVSGSRRASRALLRAGKGELPGTGVGFSGTATEE